MISFHRTLFFGILSGLLLMAIRAAAVDTIPKDGMLALMSPDDPPVWLQSTIENPGIPTDLSELIHHGLQSLAVMEQANALGIECQAYIPALEVDDPAGDNVIKFMLDRL